MAKLYTYYIRSPRRYNDVFYDGGKSVITIRPNINYTLLLTLEEASRLMAAMPDAQFTKDGRIPPKEVEDPIPTPKVETKVIGAKTLEVVQAGTGTEQKVVESEVSTAYSWSDAVRRINSIATLEELDKFVPQSDIRQRVMEAYERRKKELTATI
jgi:hypothetical protein